MTLMCSTIILLICTSFQGRKSISAPKAKKSKKNAQAQDSENESEGKFLTLTIYEIALVGCMLLNFCTRGSIAVFETQNVYIAHYSFGLSHSKVGVIVGKCIRKRLRILLLIKFLFFIRNLRCNRSSCTFKHEIHYQDTKRCNYGWNWNVIYGNWKYATIEFKA